VFRPAIDGAQLRARELSESGNDKVSIEVVGAETGDPEMQATLLTEAVAEGGVSGVAISCNAFGNESLTAALAAVQEKGIPVFAWDSDCGSRDGFYSLDNLAAGKLAAQLLAKEIGDKGNVAVLSGSPTDDNIVKRTAGFKDEMAANHPNITVVETINCDPPGQDHLCPPKIDQVMMDHEVDGWFFAAVWMRIMARGDTREGLPEKIPPATLWQEAAKAGTVKTVALDSFTEALPFVEDGRIQVLIGQKYWGWGYDTIGILYEHVDKGEKLPDFIDSGTDIICEANVDQYSAAWASNDFSLELPACM
jgi:ribose transport system substrate-binding protein